MKKQKGFTLIELLVAITIMGVLVAIALVSFQGARRSARDGKRKADLEQIRSGLEMFRSDSPTGDYPLILGGLGGYLTVPNDPVSGVSYSYFPSGPNYFLCAELESGGTDSCAAEGCADCNYRTENP